ncbi:MAG: protein kinase [Desulfobacterales bacterium]|nr:protein kinase [Desulfobacterales bacterium]
MRTIDKYKVCGLLGRGGMSKVFKVEVPVIGKIVALKLLEPNPLLLDLVGAEKIRAMFMTEAATMANLRHPYIIDVWDFGEADGKLFYTMDYFCNNLGIIIGETYQTEMESRIIKTEKAIHYIRQTLEGLACLHHAAIIHRDIKPYNILITEQDTVKICDFGLHKLRGESFEGPPNLKVGSPWYAAPEQEKAPDAVDFSADLYSVGIMLYRMLTGRLPQETPTPPGRYNPDLDENWDSFILKSIAPLRRHRFNSAMEMLAVLETLGSDWLRKKERMCALERPQEDKIENTDGYGDKSQNLTLRKHCIKVAPKEAMTTFKIDRLWQPLSFTKNSFNIRSDGTVQDLRTGLIWQLAGTDFPVNWNNACSYIKALNRQKATGHNNWRLPTIAELLSLVSRTPHREDLCIEPVFSQKQKWLWSCDRRSYTAAWYVSMEMGFVSSNDFSSFYYAKGVCEN